jgi:CTP:molybdopterin cytidylyltransferase MocA
MGQPKALLPSPDGSLFVVRICRALLNGGARPVVVVTGPAHDAVAEALAAAFPASGPVVARNPDPARGQLTSLWTAMGAVVTSEVEALLMTLVDVPMVDGPTVTALIDAWRQERPPIVRPAIGDRHGHPVLFDRALFEELRAAPIERGAKDVVRRHAAQIRHVTPASEGCLIDVDTPEDYRALLGAPR